MEKKKLEQVILIVLIPIFLLSVLYTYASKTELFKKVKESTVSEEAAEDKEIDNIQRPNRLANTKYEGSAKDPLKDLFKEYIQKFPKKQTKTTVPLPSLSIQGIIWNTNMPQAIVNGQIVKEGDSVSGVRVVKIEKEGITVDNQGQEVLIGRQIVTKNYEEIKK
jgi:hypothetical protein